MEKLSSTLGFRKVLDQDLAKTAPFPLSPHKEFIGKISNISFTDFKQSWA